MKDDPNSHRGKNSQTFITQNTESSFSPAATRGSIKHFPYKWKKEVGYKSFALLL